MLSSIIVSSCDAKSDDNATRVGVAPVSSLPDGDSWIRNLSIQEVLFGTRILVTGAAGFLGAAILHRLLGDPSFDVLQVVAIVRGATAEESLKRIPSSLRHHAQPIGEGAIPKLLVLNGDCTRPNFGLEARDFEEACKAEIVLHCAGNNRFTLPFPKAFEVITDLAYSVGRFSLLTSSVKTHIHVSTTFIGWYLPDGSLITETLTPDGCGSRIDAHSKHANTYFEAKTYAESFVNNLFTPQVGRNLHSKACRIVRLATLGPAVRFPRKAWGAGHPSSPVCAAIAAHVVGDEEQLIGPNVGLDIVPVDLAVNQILAVTASAHALQRLPETHRLHPKTPQVPCYHIACGRGEDSEVLVRLLNSSRIKIKKPYIPAVNLLRVFDPFISKNVHFDILRTRIVLGLPPLKVDDFRAIDEELLADVPLRNPNLPVDVVTEIKDEWGPGPEEGWNGYLQMIRNAMDFIGPRCDWEAFVG
ncbi:male sterility protein-domain-containing protein [Zopfochytrium polystomum]|nr:male sterility protein-domain-containing protein [Zopfochytrium polystomum]